MQCRYAVLMAHAASPHQLDKEYESLLTRLNVVYGLCLLQVPYAQDGAEVTASD